MFGNRQASVPTKRILEALTSSHGVSRRRREMNIRVALRADLARDPRLITAVVAIVGSVGLATCALAARQGLAVDPAAALRDE
jgi:hypothetical protein